MLQPGLVVPPLNATPPLLAVLLKEDSSGNWYILQHNQKKREIV
jgi:hypothetical protein